MKFCSLRKLKKITFQRWSLNLNQNGFKSKHLPLIFVLILIICLNILYGLLFSKLNYEFKMYNILPSNNYKCHSFKSNLLELDKFIHSINLNVNRKARKLANKASQTKTDLKILVFIETQYSKLGRSLTEFLQNAKFKYDKELSTFKSLPSLTNQNRGKYSLIIFENYDRYLQLSKWNFNLLNQYCVQYNVGLVGFVINKEDRTKKIHLLKRSSLFVKSNVHIKDYHLNQDSKVLRITKSGSIYKNFSPKKNWTVFYFNQTYYKPIGLAYQSVNSLLVSTVVQDTGKFDGIQRILFGNDLNLWLHKLLLLDSIYYLTNGKLSLPLERYLQIDIDDIFVGEKGTRLKAIDVDSLIAAQERFKKIVDNFTFYLGFSGKHLHKGDDEEDQGDDYLLKNVDKFKWFCHMWAHSQPHLFLNQSVLEFQMQLNQEFSQKYGFQIDSNYSVAPHHSGIYPVHEPLYDAWRNVYDVKVTSTEEYPHLRPARLRKGYIHKGVQVLPRQTCGLYTHTIFIDKYPGGRSKLDDSVFGGELFFTFIFNPVNIFMTHMSNYANDRIALYTFESVFKFIKCWTNLKFKTVQPTELASKYFKLYPEEKSPIWSNPCNDKRHLNIWASNKNCKNLPDFLIIGPQKTGTTALHTFLAMHPSIRSNYPTKEYFEELQFFNGPNYFKGLDWYLDKFPTRSDNETNKVMKLFEKSANYFDSDKVPERVHALLPNAKLIVILINPIKRAYSWYQHAKSHNDVAARNNSFFDVITTKNTQIKQLKTLRNRSLNPGCYSNYLERWLQYFNKDQLIIIDGDELKLNPINVMSELQLKLNLDPLIDYNQYLQYVSKKGFFCSIVNSSIGHSSFTTDSINSSVNNSISFINGHSHGSKNDSLNGLKINFTNSSMNISANETTNQLNNHKKLVNLIDALNGSYVGFTKLNKLNHSSYFDKKTNNTPVQIKCLGKSKGRVYPEIDISSSKFLHKYYMKCNTMLFKLLVRLKVKIPSWLLEELS